MTDPIFSSEGLQSFKEKGYVHLHEAFPIASALKMQDFMWAELYRMPGIDRPDGTTWRCDVPSKLNKTRHDPIYKEIGSTPMLGAIDQLLGVEMWSEPQGWVVFWSPFQKAMDSRGMSLIMAGLGTAIRAGLWMGAMGFRFSPFFRGCPRWRWYADRGGHASAYPAVFSGPYARPPWAQAEQPQTWFYPITSCADGSER
jgi:hypothetical protein